jgi:hypothetical protein
MQDATEDDQTAFNSYLGKLTVFGGKTVDCVPNIIKLKNRD